MSKKLKCVCISDTHGLHGRFFECLCAFEPVEFPDGDVLLFCGDIESDYRGFGRFLREDMAKFKHKLIVAGNHDLEREVLQLADPQHGIVVLDGTNVVEIEGVRFWGHPFIQCVGHGIIHGLKEPVTIPDDVDVVLSHAPPWHILDLAQISEKRALWLQQQHISCPLDCGKDAKSHVNREHWGSRILRREIERVKPVVCVFGHNHDQPGEVQIGPTRFINAASCVTAGEPFYRPPICFEILPRVARGEEEEEGGERGEEEEEEEEEEEGEGNAVVPMRLQSGLGGFLAEVDGKLTIVPDASTAPKWILHPNGKLECVNTATFLTVVEKGGITLHLVDEECGEASRWRFSEGNVLVLVGGTGNVLDVDQSGSGMVILWQRKTQGDRRNQSWRFV